MARSRSRDYYLDNVSVSRSDNYRRTQHSRSPTPKRNENNRRRESRLFFRRHSVRDTNVQKILGTIFKRLNVIESNKSTPSELSNTTFQSCVKPISSNIK